MSTKPIALFDSGLGGLSVWKAVRELLPEESLLYMGDGLNCPYGDKSEEEVAELTLKSVERLITAGAKMVVIACNTATIAAISKLRVLYPDVLFVGLEPAIKPACLATKSGVVGVLATQRSLEGEKYKENLAKYSEGIKVINSQGAGFVELVEAGLEQTAKAEEVVRPIIEAFLTSSVDQIVLGCTHYPFLRPAMERVIGSRSVDIIDPAPSVARQVLRLLEQKGLRAPSGNLPEYQFITEADESYANRLQARAAALIDKSCDK